MDSVAEYGSAKDTGSVALKNNTIIVVLGASGDLSKKKTFPALFGLHSNGHLPEDVRIVGYARSEIEHNDFLKRVTSNIKTPTKDIETKLNEFRNICSYVSGQYDKDDSYVELRKHIEGYENGREETNRLFYMALPPGVFIPVSQRLKRLCYPKKGVARVIIEKPFGKDLESSRELHRALAPDWREDETFRIDHYLGKEMVKNMTFIRFGNELLGATWNRDHIANVQITFKEPFGTEGRGGYFDEFGIIRDVMQNHMLQILTLIAMERPVSFSAEDVRDEKVRALKAMAPIDPKEVLIGQYGPGQNSDKPGYLEDSTVPEGSRCPTFAAIALHVKNDRWEGVPFIMKAGKALDEQLVEIRIQYKDVATGKFSELPRNELLIQVQPNESISLNMNTKLPGLTMEPATAKLSMAYKNEFPKASFPEAYESLILDVLKGDHSNFVRDDELDFSWRVFTPVLHHLDENKDMQPLKYPYGSSGPSELKNFIASYGYKS